jgi:hypothetical protein
MTGGIDGLARAAPVLAELDGDLGRLTASTEGDFLAIGDTLGRAVTAFGGLAGQFDDLAGHLHSHDSGSVAAALERVMDSIKALGSQQQGGTAENLRHLDQAAAELGKRLGVLGKIIGEIGALAINGKIQAASVSAAGIDFSVFTTEIGRLGTMAEATAQQAGRRLVMVRGAVAEALSAAAAFEAKEGRELEAVRNRIQSSLEVISERRRAAARAAEDVAARTSAIAQRVASTVGELQINDNVCQRIEHVRSGLRDMAAMARGEVGGSDRLAGGMCRLLADQLTGGGAEYGDQVEGLLRNLSALSGDAAAIGDDTERAFGSANGGLFLSQVEQDMRRAAELLAALDAGRAQAAGVVAAVAENFRAMAEDLSSIRSIDADMRIMGLNATFKCGRLGGSGRALGVVAQELRACSKRTEDCTRSLVEVLDNALAATEALVSASAADSAGETPLTVMTASLDALTAMSADMAGALERMRAGCDGIAADLRHTVAEVDVHLRLKRIVGAAAGRLGEVSRPLAAMGEPDDGDHQIVADLMYPRYTMDQERHIHNAFAGHHAIRVAAPVSAAVPADETLDDLLF